MTRSYLSHFVTIFFVHALALMGTWQLSKSEFVRAKLGTGVMKLQIATDLVMAPKVQKKEVRAVPINPTKPKVKDLPTEEKKVVEKVDTEAKAVGSEHGTSAKGKTDLLSVYKAELRAMIDKNKYYPPMSRRLGQTGTVVVAFTLLEDGNIIDVKVDRPSRYERLNDSAVDAVKKVGRFKPIPKEVGEVRMDIKVPVKFFTI